MKIKLLSQKTACNRCNRQFKSANYTMFEQVKVAKGSNIVREEKPICADCAEIVMKELS